MTHLNIQQVSDVEIVSAQIIKKLYDTALTVSEPLEGETDTAYMSGNLLVYNASRKACTYLTTRFHNLHIDVKGAYYIDFEDPAVESALISAGISSDGAGITETDAADAVLYQEDLISLKNTLTTFNEFNKFTTSNTANYNFTSRFKDFTNLTSINLTALTRLHENDFRNTGITVVNAPNLTGLGYRNGNSVFLECSNLTTVQNLGSLTSIPSECFKDCTSLTSVNLPSSVTGIRGNAFENCTSLSLINLNNITTISGKNSFKNCSSLTGDLSLPNLINLGQYSFSGCTGITSVSNLGLIQELRTDGGGYLFGAFDGCTNLTEMVFPVTLKRMNFNIFGSSNCYVSKFIFPYGFTLIDVMPKNNKSKNVHYIQFPSTITSMDLVEMNYYTSLNQVSMYIVIQATTPPSTNYANNGNSFNSRTYTGHPEYSRWYVPDANLNDYKTDLEWSSIASSIFPISLLQTDNPSWWAVYLANKDYGVPSQS